MSKKGNDGPPPDNLPGGGLYLEGGKRGKRKAITKPEGGNYLPERGVVHGPPRRRMPPIVAPH